MKIEDFKKEWHHYLTHIGGLQKLSNDIDAVIKSACDKQKEICANPPYGNVNNDDTDYIYVSKTWIKNAPYPEGIK